MHAKTRTKPNGNMVEIKICRHYNKKHRGTDFCPSNRNGGYQHMRIWGKLIKDNRLLQDHVVEIYNDDSRTAKVFAALNELCIHFDLSVPLWLDANIKEFQRHAKTRFSQDSFIEGIDFDFLEFQVIEEDY